MRLVNEKNTAIVITALLMTIMILAAMPTLPIKRVQAQGLGEHGIVGGIGTTPTNTAGYPNLGPLPPGVTPAFTFTTYSYLSVSPELVGLGQQVLVNVWTSPGTMVDFYMQGDTVQIQKPDGTIETIGPFNTYLGDCSAWFNYIPDQVGTWKIKFTMPGTYIPAGSYIPLPGSPTLYPLFNLSASIYYAPSTTAWQEFTVQKDLVASWPSVPIPNDYWTRPISSENREWYVISGNYPWTGAYYYPGGRVLYASNYQYTQYVQAPNTAHVAWRRQGNIGGLVGGDVYYQTRNVGGGNPSIIYAGRAYQTVTKPMMQLVNGTYQSISTSVWECYNLRTGQVYWDITNVPAPTNIVYEPPGISSIPGAEASLTYTVYLVTISGGRLLKYDPWTGAVNVNVSISPLTTGTIASGENVLTLQTLGSGATASYRLINWTMQGGSTDLGSRISSNISWPFVWNDGIRTAVIGQAIDYNAGLAVAGGWSMTFPNGYTAYNDRGASALCYGYNLTSIDLATGKIYFSIAANETENTPISHSTMVADRGKVAMGMEESHWTCWDSKTGAKVWESENTGYPWGEWWAYNTASYDFNESKGAIIATGYGGVYAIDWDNGHIIWHYNATAVPFEEPYNEQPFFTGVKIADGKVYAYSGEHTPSQPASRGWSLFCINATTGNLLWKITGNMAPGAVADGYLAASDAYDGYTYVFGKGQSTTSITASPKTLSQGAQVLIEGKVMDISPGDQGSILNPTMPLDSPTKPGTIPCVSPSSMETQMEYLYMQHPIDGLYHNETITGVPVILTAISSDGTVYDLGTVTTNGYYGTFSYAWAPPKEGTYTVTATFAGDYSYGSSTAATAVSVGPAPTATPTISPTTGASNVATTTDLMIYIVGTGVAIIIAVAIVGILMLRKHP